MEGRRSTGLLTIVCEPRPQYSKKRHDKHGVIHSRCHNVSRSSSRNPNDQRDQCSKMGVEVDRTVDTYQEGDGVTFPKAGDSLKMHCESLPPTRLRHDATRSRCEPNPSAGSARLSGAFAPAEPLRRRSDHAPRPPLAAARIFDNETIRNETPRAQTLGRWRRTAPSSTRAATAAASSSSRSASDRWGHATGRRVGGGRQ